MLAKATKLTPTTASLRTAFNIAASAIIKSTSAAAPCMQHALPIACQQEIRSEFSTLKNVARPVNSTKLSISSSLPSTGFISKSHNIGSFHFKPLQNINAATEFNNINVRSYAPYGRNKEWRATTVICVRKGNQVAVMGDGQVTQGEAVCMKQNAKKVRRVGKDKNIIAGFAGSTADALTLLEKLEAELEEHPGQLTRACVELAKMWRTDKYLRKLEAVMIVSDENTSLLLTGNGDVLEPEDGVIGIGSGGYYALAAARALMDQPLTAEQIARKAMQIAADICIYTNSNFVLETINIPERPGQSQQKAEKIEPDQQPLNA